jgi:hypothetical protein
MEQTGGRAGGLPGFPPVQTPKQDKVFDQSTTNNLD